jgi:hypothetical protein
MLKDPSGGFHNGYTIGTGPVNTTQTLETQAAVIRGLYAAYTATGNATLLQEANNAYNYLINTYYSPWAKAFKTEKNNNSATYTPFNLAVLAGALREASLTGNQADAPVIYTRVFKTVYNKMLLTEAEQSGETGNDSDGDGVPYIAGGTLPYVFAAEGTLQLSPLGIYSDAGDDISLRIFPNPTPDIVHVEFNLNSDAHAFITIYDNHGRLVHSRSVPGNSTGIQREKVILGSLNSGNYFLRVTINNEVLSVKKLIVSR